MKSMKPFVEPGTTFKCEGHTFTAEIVRHREYRDLDDGIGHDRWQIWRAPDISIYIMCETFGESDKPFWKSIQEHSSREEAARNAVRIHNLRTMQALALLREYHHDWINEDAVRKAPKLAKI